MLYALQVSLQPPGLLANNQVALSHAFNSTADFAEGRAQRCVVIRQLLHQLVLALGAGYHFLRLDLRLVGFALAQGAGPAVQRLQPALQLPDILAGEILLRGQQLQAHRLAQ